MTPRPDDERFRDIQDRIARIEFSERMLIQAEKDEDWDTAKAAFDSILYCLIVIGEAVKALPHGVKQSHSEIPWKEIAGMKDILTHEYFRVNGDLVRATIDIPLANLETVCAIELAK